MKRQSKLTLRFLKEIITIQKFYRKFSTLKKLKINFQSELINKSNKDHILIDFISPQNFINTKFNDTIREIFKYFKLEFNNNLLDIKNFLQNLDDFQYKKLDEAFNKSIRLDLNPIYRFISAPLNEYYWGEWNLSYQKHGYGLKIISDDIFYLGSFIKDELEGFGILIYIT